ncbi:MAG: DUF4351 domain-containing protein [Planctomycetaceae bacterium]|jgi:hypothetical protein|nr:DUF4351 domain-containing protein [Planctomycetaceae bacterium]
MGKTSWHPAFWGAMQLELKEYRDVLEFTSEYQLTSEPLRIDVLIIKKLKDVVIDKNIARIFRTYNIFEYKSPSDSLTVESYYKAHGYKLLYASQEKIDIDELSVTLVTSQHPYQLLKYLSNRHKITSSQTGIYLVEHDLGPKQIVVSKELAQDENLWLYYLNKKLTTTRLRYILTEATKYEQDTALKTYLDTLFDANINTFQEVIMSKKVDQCLKDLGLVDKWRAEGKAEGKAEGEAEGEAKGKAEMIIRILSRRLESPPKSLQKKILSIHDRTQLDELADFALTCVSLDEFATALR